ncbi:alpha/beta hydrolase [Salinactinospora qingdaonensis]|uniref:Alpha/beta hydrolase n=1 Tax=Salinactinospora qingdaonensis TaxID=702744 RepID=A0ABP7FVM6_9ACTN
MTSAPASRAGPDLTVAYGPHPEQVADVRLPADPARPAPLLLLWHGGFWRQAHDRGYLEPMAADLAGHGFAVANIEYRRAGGEGGWPTTLVDAAEAADALPDLVERAAPGRIDRDRVVRAGHSAGGHLAVWTVLRHRLPETAPGAGSPPTQVAGVLAVAPVLDLAEAWRRGLGEHAVDAFMGGGPDQFPGRYGHAAPVELGRPPVPVTLVHGRADPRVPVEMSRHYAARTACTLVEVAGADHFAVVTPTSSAWPRVLDALAALVGPEPTP